MTEDQRQSPPAGRRGIGRVFAIGAAMALSCGVSAAASIFDGMRDPEDGQFDVSEWLLDRKGFLPVPIVITEPAVGLGGGVGLLFFRDSMKESAGRLGPSGKPIAPDIYTLALAATENGTQVGAVGGVVSSADDRWRWRGGVVRTLVNLDFYGIGNALGSEQHKIGYNLDGWASMQQGLYRLGASDAWVSGRWVLIDMKNSLQAVSGDETLLPATSFAKRVSGIGPTIEYDSRDNIFTPSQGWTGSLDLTYYDPAWGSDSEFQSYRAHAFAYWPVARELVLGGRVDGRAVRGDVPFFMYPYVDLRGVPAARLQDQNTAVVETELRWNVTPRWSAIGFVGGARAWGARSDFADGASAGSAGVGFRYLLARRLGLYAGLDFAHSNYDNAVYIQVGGAWR